MSPSNGLVSAYLLYCYADSGIHHTEGDVSVKVAAAINGMNKNGHKAHVCRHEGKEWVEIDQCMLASFHEIEELVDGVHSFGDLSELFKKRHAEELSGV